MATEEVLVDKVITQEPPPVPAAEEGLWRNFNFRWICVGACIATLGSQFTGLALPWLVLKMTGDALALAAVMAISGLPQILLLLFGGSMADRFSPKRILVWAYLICAVLLITLGGLLFFGLLKLWMIDVFAFITGLVFGMSIPASFSLVAAALPGHMVPAGSSVIGSIRQIMAFVGPLLAGALLGASGDHSAGYGALGSEPWFAAAFFLDGAGLLLVAWTTANIAFRPIADTRNTEARGGFNIFPALRWFLADRQVLIVIGYWTLIVFFLSGPVRITLPLLAEQDTTLGAKAYGILQSANAGGVFLGMTALGLLRRFVANRLWRIIPCLDAAAALILICIGLLHPHLQLAVFVYAALFVLIGSRAGFVEIGWFSWFQQQIPDEIRGRATSIFMVLSTVNMAASVTFSGWLTRHMQATELFLLAGVVTMLLAFLGMLLRAAGVLKVHA